MFRRMLFAVGLLAAVAWPALAQDGVCDGIEGAWVEAVQEVVFHHGWEDNCGVDQVAYEVEVVDQTILVTELVSAPGLMYCMCPYVGDARVGGLAPGDYDVVWLYRFIYTGDPGYQYDEYCDTFVVTVPENDPVGDPGLVGFAVSGCGIDGVTAVPDGEPTLPNWGDIKALFQ